MSKRDKGFLMDIVLNMDEPFTAEQVKKRVLDDFGYYYHIREVEEVMIELSEKDLLEPEPTRCDKTIDLFELPAIPNLPRFNADFERVFMS